jgi:hypothetical protein
MKPKFESRFERSFEIEKELYLYLHITSPSMIVCFVLLGIVLVANTVSCLVFGLLYANLAVYAMGFIALFVLLYRYYAAMQAGKKRLAEDTNNKGAITVTATLTDEELISESSDRDDPIFVEFKHFKKVFETPHYYMIQTDDKMVYVFKKGAFSVGSEEEFLPFVGRILDRNKRKKK